MIGSLQAQVEEKQQLLKKYSQHVLPTTSLNQDVPGVSSHTNTTEGNKQTQPSRKTNHHNTGIFITKVCAKEKRSYDKKLACFFCSKIYRHRIVEHLVGQHSKEQQVSEALMQTGIRRKISFESIKNLGNFKHNSEVLVAGEGELIVVRRPKSANVKYDDYVPCIYCYGFYKANELWRHCKYCNHQDKDKNECETLVVTKARMMLAGSVNKDADLDLLENNVLSTMRHDEVYSMICQDDMIKRFGKILLHKLGTRRKNCIAQRMRQLARLRTELDKISGKKIELSDYIGPKGFDSLITAVELIAGHHENREDVASFNVPSYALRIGHHILKCAEIKRGMCIRQQNDDKLKDATSFISLFSSEWTDRISSVALTTLKTNKFNKNECLPLTEDLVLLKKFLVDNILRLNSEIIVNQTYESWRKLVEYTLVRIILFNKRRSNEVAMLLVETFLERVDWGKCAHQEIVNSLKPIEKKLLGRLDMVQTQGKRNKRVPIVLTHDMKLAINNIIKYRAAVGVTNNKFVFASGEKGYLNAWQIIHKTAKLAGCAQPSLISSTRLRKYIATACQVSCVRKCLTESVKFNCTY